MSDLPSRDAGTSGMSQSMSGADGGLGASPLKRARLEQGLTLEGLASLTKVTPAKLDALENGRYDELPDPAFARALAMTVCRVLKADPSAVMASLPSARPVSLGASETREVPFQATHTRLRLHTEPRAAVAWSALLAPRWLAPLALLAAAAGVYFLPQDMGWLPSFGRGGSAAPAAAPETVTESVPVPAQPAASAVPPAAAQAASVGMDGELTTPLADAAAPADAVASAPPASTLPAQPSTVASVPTAVATAAAPGTPLVLVAAESSWIEVRDARGRRLISREVAAGETIGLDGPAPLRVKIGNADAVRLTYQGSAIELAAFTRGKVATLELK